MNCETVPARGKKIVPIFLPRKSSEVRGVVVLHSAWLLTNLQLLPFAIFMTGFFFLLQSQIAFSHIGQLEVVEINRSP